MGLKAELRAFHERVASGAWDCSDGTCCTLLTHVVRRLAGRWTNVAQEDVMSAAHDALLWYLRNPARYDPSGARLDVFLASVGHRVLSSRWKTERRRRRRELPLSEASESRCENRQRVGSATDVLHIEDVRRRILAMARSHQEHEFLLQFLSGADTGALAETLGVGGRARSEQARRVHAMLQRLRQRARRAAMRGSP